LTIGQQGTFHYSQFPNSSQEREGDEKEKISEAFVREL
jgi:hypothetical protein